MNIKKILRLACALSVLAASATASSASVFTVTGTVTDQFLGYISSSSQYLGDTITISFTYEFSAGPSFFDQPGFTAQSGGTIQSVPSPISSVSYSISGGPSATIDATNAVLGEIAFVSAPIDPVGYTDSSALVETASGGYFSAQLVGRTPERGLIYINDPANGETIVALSGVPEPSTWAMMLIGFASLAFFARKRPLAQSR